ncbi:luciferase domain-containing protein [Rhodococcoides corynebacterioides]|uniref:luciferase domain-containing protein n=1 Tax=Rhodococcoides corynebacterioides TaxID=53972 RepID=UPI001C9A8134|nr:luciferase family protein [Rhodococcus corynebacterioides]MBY6364604.1 hypothetical protein [Rhodococcus corynebacterioides]
MTSNAFSDPRPVLCAAIVSTVATGLLLPFAVKDYRRWRGLGEGGLPANPLGYALTTAARIAMREACSSRPYSRLESEPVNLALLPNLPNRRGPRPRTNPDPIPQRQLDQVCPDLAIETRKIFDAAAASRSWVDWRRSGFENHHDALTALTPRTHIDTTRRTRGEIAHIHPSDGSMHMVFSGRDAAQILDKGWGERHGLAGRGPLPITYLLIYAPRSADELRVVAILLDASLAYMGQVATEHQS